MRLSVGCGPYDRVAALRDGSVRSQSLELDVVTTDGPAEVFWRQLNYVEFDVAEMSLSAYIMLLSRGDRRFVGIPAFPLRAFRHGFIFINRKAGITKPEDLAGRRVGVPEYHMTAAMYIRGMLKDDYGIAPESIEWVQGGQEKAGREERIELRLPPEIRLRVERSRSLNELLIAGEIDAIFTATAPSSVISAPAVVGRLFGDTRAVETDYYRRTGIFPIMHVVVIRAEILDQSPWVAQEVMKVFDRARSIWLRQLTTNQHLLSGLPWIELELEYTERLFGANYWPYGVAANLPTLEAATRYSFEQGLSARQVGVPELFARSTVFTHSG